MCPDIDPAKLTMPVSDIINAVIALCGNNQSKAAEVMGMERRRMLHLATKGKKNRELIISLENARKALGISKAAFWDLLTGTAK